MSLREYIEARCVPIPFAGCWLWLLSCGSHGYGQACMPGNRVTTAHRVSYIAYKGEIPDGMLVQHSCDNKWCVNPDHLSLGTDQTNSDDKHRKGRANLDARKFPPYSTRKLTPEQAATVRAATEPARVTARRFGVDLAVIQRIKSGEHYRDTFGATPGLLPLLPEQAGWVNGRLTAALEEHGDWPANDEVYEPAKVLKAVGE